MEAEIWKDVEGFEGKYMVSDQGRIKSLARLVYNKSCKSGSMMIQEKILRPGVSTSGYLTASLHDSISGGKTIPIHRMVALAFIPNLGNLPQVNHIDGCKTNNKLSNLEWITVSGNWKHAESLGLTKKQVGLKGKFNHHTSKKVVQVSFSGEQIKIWPSMAEAARNGFEKTGISRCCVGRSKFHKGFKWRFAV